MVSELSHMIAQEGGGLLVGDLAVSANTAGE